MSSMHIYDSSDCQIEINIANDELIKECRICFESGTNDNFLITPCLCDGTSKYVHVECLRRWRMENYLKKPYYRCMECNYQYITVPKHRVETFVLNEYGVLKNAGFIVIQVLSMNTMLSVLQYNYFENTFDILTFGINNTATDHMKFILRNNTGYAYLYNLSLSSQITDITLTFLFTICLFCSIHRLPLYYENMKRHIWCKFFMLLNPMAMFFVYLVSNDFSFYLLYIFFNSFLRFIYEPKFVTEHNHVIFRINRHHNEEKVINYKRYNLIDNDDEF